MAYQPAQVSQTTGPLLLKKVTVPPRSLSLTILQEPNLGKALEELEWIFSEHDTSDILAIDFETKGTDASSEDDFVVGVSFADTRGSVYVPLRRTETFHAITHLIYKYKQLYQF